MKRITFAMTNSGKVRVYGHRTDELSHALHYLSYNLTQ